MKIKLNNIDTLDLQELIASKLLVQANSGGGKSWAIRRIIEQAFPHVQIIVIDPEGEFGNLRSKYDFVYAGKDGDAPVESRSAALLAKRLLELKASAIIDLYELPPQERKHFVRLFCEAMVNAPKELWHDCLVIIDEAHVFAPEKSDSEALGPVIDLASRGRKRGYSLVLASQRISKLHKDAAAECNNKLIGRTSLDIDRKRAGEELGLTSREEVLALRNLLPGEFMVFGPALGRDVKRIHIGDIHVKPEKRGVSRLRPPAPSAAVKKILSQLADLPKEAAEEAKTIQGLQSELRAAKVQIGRLERGSKEQAPDPVAVQKVISKSYDLGFEANKTLLTQANKEIERLSKMLQQVARLTASEVNSGAAPNFVKIKPEDFKNLKLDIKVPGDAMREVQRQQEDKRAARMMKDKSETAYIPDGSPLGKGEIAVLKAIAQYGDEGLPNREAITTLTGYKRSTRDAYMARLQARNLIFIGSSIKATEEGLAVLGPNFEPLPTGEALREHLYRTLPDGERRILAGVVSEYPNSVSRETLSEWTSYKRSTRDAYIARLANRQLVEISADGIRAVEKLI